MLSSLPQQSLPEELVKHTAQAAMCTIEAHAPWLARIHIKTQKHSGWYTECKHKQRNTPSALAAFLSYLHFLKLQIRTLGETETEKLKSYLDRSHFRCAGEVFGGSSLPQPRLCESHKHWVKHSRFVPDCSPPTLLTQQEPHLACYSTHHFVLWY